jgi:TrpR-related protein YerC/YecD
MKKLRKVGVAKILDKEEVEQDLFQAFAMLQTKEEVKKFLQDLCTPAEIQAMADRWKVVDLLKQGEPYRQIYEKTGVSVTTIGRVARCLLLGEGGYNLIYKRLHK